MEMFISLFLRKIKNHIPLKQGLRHEVFLHNPFRPIIKNHIPLKQGLRLIERLMSSNSLEVLKTIFH